MSVNGWKWLEMSLNGWKMLEIALYSWKWYEQAIIFLESAYNVWKFMEIIKHDWTWLEIAWNCLKWLQMAGNGWNDSTILKKMIGNGWKLQKTALHCLNWNCLKIAGFGWTVITANITAHITASITADSHRSRVVLSELQHGCQSMQWESQLRGCVRALPVCWAGLGPAVGLR